MLSAKDNVAVLCQIHCSYMKTPVNFLPEVSPHNQYPLSDKKLGILFPYIGYSGRWLLLHWKDESFLRIQLPYTNENTPFSFFAESFFQVSSFLISMVETT